MEIFRSELGYIDDKPVNGGYQQRGSWPSSADNFLLLLENLIYGYRFDGILKQNIKSRRSAEDTLNHAEIRPLVLFNLELGIIQAKFKQK